MTVLNEFSPQTTGNGAGVPTIQTAVLDKAHHLWRKCGGPSPQPIVPIGLLSQLGL